MGKLEINVVGWAGLCNPFGFGHLGTALSGQQHVNMYNNDQVCAAAFYGASLCAC